MQFVQNLNNLILDDQYFLEVPVADGSAAAPTGNIGMVGTFSRGPLNTPVLVTSYPELIKKFGDVDADMKLTGTLTARGIFKQGNANLYVVRVSSSTTPAAPASLDIKNAADKVVLKLKAKTPGTWGNSLVAAVSKGSKDNTFKVELQYGAEFEAWDNLVIVEPGTPIPGAMLASAVFGANGASQLASAEITAADNTEFPANGSYSLSGGLDGEDAAATDYIGTSTGGVKKGLAALDSAPINLILAAEQGDTAINEALIANAESITQNGGLPRVALITFPKTTAVSGLAALTKASSHDTDRAIALFPWVNIFDTTTNSNRTVSPVGYFAGVLAQLQPHLSAGNKKVSGILGTDPNQNIGPAELVAMVQARVNAIGVQTPAGQLGIRGSFTLSLTEAQSQIHVRRMQDYINQLVSQVGGQFVDQPITEDLMRQVFHCVDNILQPMKSPIAPGDQMIADYKVVCDASNNPAQSIAQNRLVCDYAVKLLNVNRFMIFRTQIGTGVVITKQS
jgi:phage tail sheath protein FI